MKINLSKIFRYILLVLLNILCIFVIQYYINSQLSVSKSLSDLKIAIFINNSVENTEEELLSIISEYNKLKNIEFINSFDNSKFLEISSYIEKDVLKEIINFPHFIIADRSNINSFYELENFKNELLSLEFAEDVVYDQKAYKMFFDNKELLDTYQKIFLVIFYVMIFLFVLKLLFFIIKNLNREILFEIGYGILLGLIAYIVICLITIFNHNSVFVLDWQVLYMVLPLSSMFCLLTKETNV